MIKSLINRIKIYQKVTEIAAEKSVVKRKYVKGWELADKSNKIVAKSFRGVTTNQRKSNQIQKILFYIVVLMM